MKWFDADPILILHPGILKQKEIIKRIREMESRNATKQTQQFTSQQQSSQFTQFIPSFEQPKLLEPLEPLIEPSQQLL